jgi:hypothetical protein
VNDVVLDPSADNFGPTADVIRSNLEKLHNKKTLCEQLFLCGLKIDSNIVQDFTLTSSIVDLSFPLPLSIYLTSVSNPLRQNVLNAIKNAFQATNPYAPHLNTLRVELQDNYTDVLALKSFYDYINVPSFYINPSIV